ncbi:conserved hypothetical protein [Methylobacterium sp. 4-46]|uniref:cellulose biosynthesis cyclic di-GMP-binding regulatory protein BcsB n=1 Tax=unclassified Methylobacterium TaxID=2615210 RepID=UPI000152D050|nr:MULTISPECIES: cellulose biosynthesis cyclic di-GMP-binding regulatory protein BcsB [Methylobacterium]ACA14691.1 conserved hypothetical protein [Methylobacterium sp. 4-46]WFT80444.1 cellulose biosynthesis cyclic di-GMP-binding regulatory protein BcsB [Methylobacterium nodulans]
MTAQPRLPDLLPIPAAPVGAALRRIAGTSLIGLALLLPQGAGAQSFLGRGAPQVLSVPDAAGAAPGRPAEAAPAPEGAAVPAPALLPQRPLPAGRSGLRLSGEESGLQWSVYLTEAEAREHLRFRIGYLAAISVVPETSSLTLSINDAVVGRTAIRAPSAVRVVEFDVPPGLLRPGYNAVAVAAVQRHRVDCSLPATYELWTQVDPSWTGFVLPPGTGTAQSLRDLAAVPPDPRGVVPIRVMLRSRPTFETFERIIGLVQRVALAGGYSHVAVEFGSAQQGPSGLNLVVASPDELREVANVEAGEVASGQPLTVLPAQATRATTLIVPGTAPADLDAAAEAVTASAAHEPVGSPQGLRALALARGAEIRGGETLRLADLGLQNREFSGRLFRAGFDVVLPSDVIAADYGKVVLTLEGGYAAGLDPEAQVIVDVNRRNAASAPLPRAEGEVFRDAQIGLPLGRWRPGRNRVDVTALLPAASDRACSDAEADRKRFLFLGETKVAFPRLARALRLPDLAATAGGGAPYRDAPRRPRLVVPAPDRASMSAAATIAVRLALAAGRPIDFELATERAAERRGPTVVVGPVRTLDPDLLRTVGLDPQQVQQIWQGRAAQAGAEIPQPAGQGGGLSLDRLRSDIPPACALPAAPSRSIAVAQRGRSSARAQAADLVTSWGASLRGAGAGEDGLAGIGARLGAVLQEAVAAASRWLDAQVREAEIEVDARTSLIAGQGLMGRDPDATLTVFTAPTPAALQASVTCLTAPSVWDRLEGRVAVLDGNDGAVRTYAARHAILVETAPRSFENLRLIVAGWFSSNPNAFALIILASAAALGLSTSAMLRGVGRTGTGRRGDPDRGTGAPR